MSNANNRINFDRVPGTKELDDVVAAQLSGGVSLSVIARAGESAAGAITSDGRRAEAGNGEVRFEDDLTADTSSSTFPNIFGDFSFVFSD